MSTPRSRHIIFESTTALPVTRYGGTERIIYWLMKELVRKGQRVSLIAPKDSRVSSLGVTLIERGPDWTAQIPKDADLVHLFAPPPEAWRQKREHHYPFICTIEGNGRPNEVFHPNTVFISKNHALRHDANVFVYNGLDLDEYPAPQKTQALRWERFLFLAKAKWPVKNLAHCVNAVTHAHKQLEIAGGRHWRWPLRFSFFPVRSHGMIDQQQKLSLLPLCDALLFPVRWHEPFGIAVIEAMAMGLPVIGSPYGSLPELILSPSGAKGNEAIAGMICRNYAELESAVSKTEYRRNPSAIRKHVETYFSSIVMAERYLELYEHVIAGKTLHAHEPKTRSQTSAETLLDF